MCTAHNDVHAPTRVSAFIYIYVHMSSKQLDVVGRTLQEDPILADKIVQKWRALQDNRKSFILPLSNVPAVTAWWENSTDLALPACLGAPALPAHGLHRPAGRPAKGLWPQGCQGCYYSLSSSCGSPCSCVMS